MAWKQKSSEWKGMIIGLLLGLVTLIPPLILFPMIVVLVLLFTRALNIPEEVLFQPHSIVPYPSVLGFLAMLVIWTGGLTLIGYLIGKLIRYLKNKK